MQIRPFMEMHFKSNFVQCGDSSEHYPQKIRLRFNRNYHHASNYYFNNMKVHECTEKILNMRWVSI